MANRPTVKEAWVAFTQLLEEEIEGLEESGDEIANALGEVLSGMLDSVTEMGFADAMEELGPGYEPENVMHRLEGWGFA